MTKRILALAGQPNCGKSTIFNGLTGAKQYVANYPGVTVDKMVGWYKREGTTIEVVDLPGTYSLTSYSPEEQVSRDFLIHDKPSAVINVVDASNLKRGLYLTFQLMEMNVPMLLDLNMMDVARKAGMDINIEKLSKELGIPVVATSMRSGEGKKELLNTVDTVFKTKRTASAFTPHYPELSAPLKELEALLSSEAYLKNTYPLSWLALKLLENDEEALRLIHEKAKTKDVLLEKVKNIQSSFEAAHKQTTDLYISSQRYKAAAEMTSNVTVKDPKVTGNLSDRIDRVLCHKILGPVMLLGVIYMLYRLSIVEGYRLTNYTWPILAGLRAFIESLLPAPGFINIPMIREFVLWCVDSANALLNYIPIFFILFALIAFLEDSGYMPRMAFIMDRILSRYGLHGQSTLSMVLGGVVVGGCIVPGVMSTKGIPDERSRLATILTLPMLNCLAKVPLYILLINIYFADHKPLVMFFISTISILFVLPVAKILSLTVLKKKQTAPFIMEMPPYHVPTFRGVFGRAVERVWLYIRKITTVVVAVAVVLFALLQFPGLNTDQMTAFENRKNEAVSSFMGRVRSGGIEYSNALKTEDDVLSLIMFQEEYRNARRRSGGDMTAANKDFEARNAVFYKIITDRKDRKAQTIERALRTLVNVRRSILLEMRQQRIESSILGKTGKALEPVSQWAGFNWRVNIAVLSSLAAKESTVATLGALYQPPEDSDEEESLESRMASQETGFTALHAVALMLFMVLCPPCFPTAIAIKVQTGSSLWMLFSFFYPLILGLLGATLVFSGGNALGLTGLQTMWLFYTIPLALTVITGLISNRTIDTEQS